MIRVFRDACIWQLHVGTIQLVSMTSWTDTTRLSTTSWMDMPMEQTHMAKLFASGRGTGSQITSRLSV